MSSKEILRRGKHLFLEFKKDTGAFVGFTGICFILILGVVGPFFYPYSPNEQSFQGYLPPSVGHIMGTDNLGRDLLARIISGVKVAFYFSFLAAGISLIAGLLIGSIGGFYGGWIDEVLSRVTDVTLTFPALLLIIYIASMLGRNMLIAITVIGLTMWPSNAKVARAQILSLKQREFVQASRVLGMGNSRILVLHIIPNIISPVLANSALQMGYAILIEAMLAFVGLGDLNVATWGQLIYSGQSSLTSAPWITFFPGVFIICFVVFCNLVGEGISKLRVKI